MLLYCPRVYEFEFCELNFTQVFAVAVEQGLLRYQNGFVTLKVRKHTHTRIPQSLSQKCETKFLFFFVGESSRVADIEKVKVHSLCVSQISPIYLQNLRPINQKR